MAVRSAPTKRPRIGFSKATNKFRKAGTSASPLTAEVMVSMPDIRVAKPKRIMPVSFFWDCLKNIYSTSPVNAKIGVKEVGFNIFTKMLFPSIPPRERIQLVTVVPTLAPIITLMD